jgi:hypothetical protein
VPPPVNVTSAVQEDGVGQVHQVFGALKGSQFNMLLNLGLFRTTTHPQNSKAFFCLRTKAQRASLTQAQRLCTPACNANLA